MYVHVLLLQARNCRTSVWCRVRQAAFAMAVSRCSIRDCGGRSARTGSTTKMLELSAGCWDTSTHRNHATGDFCNRSLNSEVSWHFFRGVAFPQFISDGRFGPAPSSFRIWIDNLDCDGDEASIDECQRNALGDTDCTHDDVSTCHLSIDRSLNRMSIDMTLLRMSSGCGRRVSRRSNPNNNFNDDQHQHHHATASHLCVTSSQHVMTSSINT